MRLSEFRELVAEEFGAQADMRVRSHVLAEFGNRTASEAIEQGEPVVAVWRELCREFDVPKHRW